MLMMLSLLLENRKHDAADAHDARPAAGETEKVKQLMLMMLSLLLEKSKTRCS